MTIQRDWSTGLAAGSTGIAFIGYNGTTKSAGKFDGGTTAPSNTTRLNYDGNLYANTFYASSTSSWGTNSTVLSTTEYTDRLLSIPISSTTTTAVLTDKGKCIVITAGLTIPASVFAAGDIVSLYNNSAADLTITQGSGLTLRKSGSTTTGNLVLPLRGIASIWFLSATEAIMSGAK